ncbi:MAG: 3-hydroxyacyl-CoA dehydrogenase NAD-binding domain-containing protein, partial [Verrucomicrobiota bacterium]
MPKTKTLLPASSTEGEMPPLPHIQRIEGDGVVTLRFDDPDSSANVLNASVFAELHGHLDQVESQSDSIQALLFDSAKPFVFLAGADLKTLSDASPTELEEVLTLGQDTFQRIANLPIPTAALIHGACLGGGLELALSCDWRIASESSSTKLGLPETQLGILPAWGGTSRLPRLIGLPRATKMILSGAPLCAKEAHRVGLVHAVAPKESLHRLIRRLLKGPLPTLQSHRANLPILRHAFGAITLRKIQEQTKENYPAPPRAMRALVRGLGLPLPKALEEERKAFLELVQTPHAKQLLRTFFLQDRAKRLRGPSSSVRDWERASIIGAGVMGAGIAHWLSSRGKSVRLQDIHVDAVAAGMERLHSLFATGIKRRKLTRREAERALDRITPSHSPLPLERQDLIIEAASEDLEIKKAIFADLAARSSSKTVLATNTSALSVTSLAESLPIEDRDRVIGLHFFNPVHRMK